MAWFKREHGDLDTSGEKKVKTEGLWVKCDQCRQIIWKKDLEASFNVCPKCGSHGRIDAVSRLKLLFDSGEYEIEGQPAKIRNPSDATSYGIQTVYQDLALCNNLDAVQNLFLGRELTGSPWFGRRIRRAE